eukprot:4792215-Lingulodinium_polyedra.AAC.1
MLGALRQTLQGAPPELVAHVWELGGLPTLPMRMAPRTAVASQARPPGNARPWQPRWGHRGCRQCRGARPEGWTAG